MAKMTPPKKGKAPKRITTKNPPGGPSTPGAKAKNLDDVRRTTIGRGN